MSLSAKIGPKLKTCQKTGIFDDLSSILAQYYCFLKTIKFIFRQKAGFFDNPGTPEGTSIVKEREKSSDQTATVAMFLDNKQPNPMSKVRLGVVDSNPASCCCKKLVCLFVMNFNQRTLLRF